MYSQLYPDPKYHISDLEWQVLQDIYDILEAVILSTIIHPALSFQWFKENWPQHCLHEAQRIILRELRKSDTVAETTGSSPQQTSCDSQSGFNVFSLIAGSQPEPSTVAGVSASPLESEWDTYCNATNLPDMCVDIIKWWQDADHEFSTMMELLAEDDEDEDEEALEHEEELQGIPPANYNGSEGEYIDINISDGPGWEDMDDC
ncbi:hypothetical protein M422DRAFT_250255 [Sphaerobolus stellatus SS14]|uniref:Uncharacterized protein n=1 Tax=Sphaerobolus stellatus (strain SS14) TaxID=990650 RepID=A0A0C9VU78_SPHS4|nr:hypothetical protein M422DRAFT_250255 [Sphaerobolus stellatus SS14]